MPVNRNPETGKIIAQYPTMEWVQEASEDYRGWCLACGAEKDMVEPDARGYECEECGMRYVYGAEELVLMGRVK